MRDRNRVSKTKGPTWMWTRTWAHVFAASAAWLCASCSLTTGELPHPGSCDPFELTGSSPAVEAVDVPVDTRGTLRFNDFPNPDSVGPQNISLWTGVYYHVGQFSVSLVDRSVSFRPASPLAPDRQYTLALAPTVRSLRGCEMQGPTPNPNGWAETEFHVPFRTAMASPPPTDPRPLPPQIGYVDVLALFARRCSGAGCHLATGATGRTDAPEETECAAIPASDLSLCPRDAQAQLIGIAARQVPRLVRVAPHDSARSYLLRKLVGAPPVIGHESTPVSGGPTISTDDLHLLEAWIDSGAPK